MKKLLITAEWLRQEPRVYECDVRKFEKLFPNGAPCTLATFRKAQKALNVWCLENKFAKARLEAYMKAGDDAWEAYVKARADGWKASRKVKGDATEAYLNTTADALEAYEKAKARALVAALRAELSKSD